MVELTWEGKYDANGKRTAPLRLALPFQTVEMVNGSAQERQMAQAGGRPAVGVMTTLRRKTGSTPRFSPTGTGRGGGSGATGALL